MFRRVETPVYTNVYSDSKGVFGVVEYNSHRELRDVIADMRGVEFKNPFCEPTPVDLIDDTDDADRDPAGSTSPPPPRRERSRSADPGSPRRDRDRRSRSRCDHTSCFSVLQHLLWGSMSVATEIDDADCIAMRSMYLQSLVARCGAALESLADLALWRFVAASVASWW